MMYELYYWPSIQGRGEFVRLALEEAGARYRDVARELNKKSGVPAMMRLLGERAAKRLPFAPPFLKAGTLVVGQTANILQFLGTRHALTPTSQNGRLWVNELQLTVADFIAEIHDTHHPVGVSLYYEDQKKEARRKSNEFLQQRLPKFLNYYERILAAKPRGNSYVLGTQLCYVDLSLFQVVAGLNYAFPRSMRRAAAKFPRLYALHDKIQQRPRIAAYLASPRRIAFNEDGIFRHYPELDTAPRVRLT
jgi:glutathione S-transferase